MLELGVGADLLRGLGWLFWALFAAALLTALIKPKSLAGKVISAFAVIALFFGPLIPGVYENHEAQSRYEKAKALFDERCKTAGEKIYRTVEGVDGIQLLKIREFSSGEGQTDSNAVSEHYGDGYIQSFLLYERDDEKFTAKALVYESRVTSRPGYRYVVAIDPKDKKQYRYTLGSDLRLKREEFKGLIPRFGVTFDDPIIPGDREYWIAGSTVQVIDVQANEILGQYVRYVMDPGQGSRAGQRTPWLFAKGCNLYTRYSTGSTRFFVTQVLRPIQSK